MFHVGVIPVFSSMAGKSWNETAVEMENSWKFIYKREIFQQTMELITRGYQIPEKRHIHLPRAWRNGESLDYLCVFFSKNGFSFHGIHVTRMLSEIPV